MTNLSPAAESVLNAVTLKRYDVPYFACPKSIDQIRSDTAAVLRAAADQVVPTEMDLPPIAPDLGHFRQHERRLTRQRLLAIATELENQ
jgi:hypothetical protein